MEEYEANLGEIGVIMDDLVALLPEEPATELEAKAAQLVAQLVIHLEMLASMEDEEGEDEVLEDEAAAETEVVDVEAA
jgi:hypothetical protein